LVITQEDPQGLGQGEDELPVREGEQQLLIEVLGEQECSLLAAGWTEVGAICRKRDGSTRDGIRRSSIGYAPGRGGSRRKQGNG
jgi:hypothetical protein